MIYYNADPMLSKGCPINISMSGRGAGKSTDIAYKVIKDCVENGKQFILLTRNSLCKMDRYFEGYLREKLIEEFNHCVKIGYGNELLWTDGDPVTKRDKNGELYTTDEVIGFKHYLSLQTTYKSNQFEKVKYIIFEEAMTQSAFTYYPGEFDMWLSYLSTIFRHRKDGVAILVGNVLTASNPYFEGYGIPQECLKEYGIKVYDSAGAKICVDVAKPAYETKDEIPLFMRAKGNEMNISGIYTDQSEFVIDITEKQRVDLIKNKSCVIVAVDEKYNIGVIKRGKRSYPFVLRVRAEGIRPTPRDVMRNKAILNELRKKCPVLYFSDDFAQASFEAVRKKYM